MRAAYMNGAFGASLSQIQQDREGMSYSTMEFNKIGKSERGMQLDNGCTNVPRLSLMHILM